MEVCVSVSILQEWVILKFVIYSYKTVYNNEVLVKLYFIVNLYKITWKSALNQFETTND